MTTKTKNKIMIELVNEKGKVVGLGEKFEVHKNPVPLHRAISVVIYSTDGKKMLLQKRAEDKPTWPLFWSNTTCTHPYPKESYKDAASRRLKEEMGFSVPLKEILRFTYSAEYDTIWGENEYDVVFDGQYDGKITADPNEAADHKWVGVDWIKKDVQDNPQLYSPWFKSILDKI